MKKLTRLFAVALMALSLTGGIAAADQTGSNGTTGPDSTNVVVNKTKNHLDVNNDNNIHFSNYNHQHAYSGEAVVAHNTTGGGATSGMASNANHLSADISLDNTGAGSFSMGGSGGQSGTNNLTGPDSTNKVINKVSNSVDIHNDNNICVTNTNSQTATSGEAKVVDNTTGGSATSGDATNTNTASFSVSVSN